MSAEICNFCYFSHSQVNSVQQMAITGELHITKSQITIQLRNLFYPRTTRELSKLVPGYVHEATNHQTLQWSFCT